MVTIKRTKSTYRHLCRDRRGKWHAGEERRRGVTKKKHRPRRKARRSHRRSGKGKRR